MSPLTIGHFFEAANLVHDGTGDLGSIQGGTFHGRQADLLDTADFRSDDFDRFEDGHFVGQNCRNDVFAFGADNLGAVKRSQVVG